MLVSPAASWLLLSLFALLVIALCIIGMCRAEIGDLRCVIGELEIERNTARADAILANIWLKNDAEITSMIQNERDYYKNRLLKNPFEMSYEQYQAQFIGPEDI